MLYQIATLLLDVIGRLLTGACLLRLYMQYQQIPMSARSGNPMGKFIFAFTDWLVLPLRKVVPAVGRSADSQWVQIFLADLKVNGWVFASLVTIEGDMAALPIAE